MCADPIVEATRLAEQITVLLDRAANRATGEHARGEVRFAEALARTLADQLAVMRGAPVVHAIGQRARRSA
jgi:hypothetical protein